MLILLKKEEEEEKTKKSSFLSSPQIYNPASPQIQSIHDGVYESRLWDQASLKLIMLT